MTMGIRIFFELRWHGLNHAKFFDRYDDGFGRQCKGFQFRLKPLFFIITIAV